MPKNIDTDAKSPAGVIVFTSTFMINHFELFGLHQLAAIVGREAGARLPDAVPLQFRPAPNLSQFHHRVLGSPDDERRASAVRGGDYAYIFIGIALEERDLVGMFGDEYRHYRERVSMLFPWRKLI